MVRYSKKAKLQKELENILENGRLLRELLSSTESDSDAGDDCDDNECGLANSIKDELDLLNDAICDQLEDLLSQRYSTRPLYRKRGDECRFTKDLETGEGAWLTDEEFLQKYRMTRDSFKAIVDLIKYHPVFLYKGRGPHQPPAAHQLMVLLRYLGSEGSGGCSPDLRNIFGISKGTVDLYKRRAVIALMDLRDQVIFWPDEAERARISQRIRTKYAFPDCVGLVDGTLFPLRFKPDREDAPDYSGRKHAYSLSTMIICDDQKRIRHYLAGWPGTAHDNRIFADTDVARDPDKFFTALQYILGDSAFEVLRYLIPAFKKPRGLTIPHDQEYFNTALGKARVLSEHCIGILKGRFPWLKCIPCKLTEDEESMRHILEYIDCCVILHNLLVQRNDNVDATFWDPRFYDDFVDPDATAREREAEVGLNQPVPEGAGPGARREQLCEYINNTVIF
jgi:DDE superfamily endonuclease